MEHTKEIYAEDLKPGDVIVYPATADTDAFTRTVIDTHLCQNINIVSYTEVRKGNRAKEGVSDFGRHVKLDILS